MPTSVLLPPAEEVRRTLSTTSSPLINGFRPKTIENFILSLTYIHKIDNIYQSAESFDELVANYKDYPSDDYKDAKHYLSDLAHFIIKNLCVCTDEGVKIYFDTIRSGQQDSHLLRNLLLDCEFAYKSLRINLYQKYLNKEYSEEEIEKQDKESPFEAKLIFSSISSDDRLEMSWNALPPCYKDYSLLPDLFFRSYFYKRCDRLREKLKQLNLDPEAIFRPYVCQISFEVMSDPVYIHPLQDVRYERADITKWLQRKGTCPIERTRRFDLQDIRPCTDFKHKIAAFLSQQEEYCDNRLNRRGNLVRIVPPLQESPSFGQTVDNEYETPTTSAGEAEGATPSPGRPLSRRR